jgi:hypothetical protein
MLAKVKKLIGEKVAFLLPLRWRARLALGRYTRTPISAVAEGERVKMVGQVRPHEPLLKSPISGQACVFYRLVVQELFVDGEGHQRGATIATDERRCAFAVVDATGAALVQPDAAQMNVPTFWEDRHHPAVERIARESPSLSAGLILGKHFRYQEAVLCSGATVAVLGAGHLEAHAGDGSSHGAPYRGSGVRLVFAGTREQPLIVSSSLEDWIDDSLPPA